MQLCEVGKEPINFFLRDLCGEALEIPFAEFLVEVRAEVAAEAKTRHVHELDVAGGADRVDARLQDVDFG
jgi:hypothetical protein